MRLNLEDNKYIRRLLEISQQFNIDKLRHTDLKEEYTSFEGSPKRHPSNENILLLVTNPFDANMQFYEFNLETVSAVEEIGTITSEDSKSSYQVRIWVKKGTLAVKSETFIV